MEKMNNNQNAIFFRMNNQHNILCLSFLVFFLFFYPAIASATQSESIEETPDWYGLAYIGNNIGNSGPAKFETTTYYGGGSYEWGIGFGKHVTKVFSLEGAFEFSGERYKRSGVIIPGTENNIIQAGGQGLSVTALYNVNNDDFYGYAGIGAAYFSTGIMVTEPGSGLLTSDGAPSRKWLPAYHLTAGINYRFKGNHKLGVAIIHRILNADFGIYTNGDVDLGDTYLLFIIHISK